MNYDNFDLTIAVRDLLNEIVKTKIKGHAAIIAGRHLCKAREGLYKVIKSMEAELENLKLENKNGIR